MKKLISILAIFCFTFSFSQIKVDLTKKQAYERFKNSNVRKACKIPLNEFNEIFKRAKLNTEGKLSEEAIFNSTKEKKLVEFISSEYGRSYVENEYARCGGCDEIIYSSFKEIKDLYKDIL